VFPLKSRLLLRPNIPLFVLCIKRVLPVACRIQLIMWIPAAPWFARRVVLPMKVRLLLRAEIPPPVQE